jgi:hypothetical protein
LKKEASGEEEKKSRGQAEKIEDVGENTYTGEFTLVLNATPSVVENS